MTVAETLRELLRSDDPPVDGTVIYECRQCGTKSDERMRRCPTCEGDEIARYEFPPEGDAGDEGSTRDDEADHGDDHEEGDSGDDHDEGDHEEEHEEGDPGDDRDEADGESGDRDADDAPASEPDGGASTEEGA